VTPRAHRCGDDPPFKELSAAPITIEDMDTLLAALSPVLYIGAIVLMARGAGLRRH
jgi:hypothetical protein